MIAQDLTKFTVVLVVLGLVLAIAIFRPQILPPLNSEPNEKPSQAPGIITESNPEQWGDEEGSRSYEDLLTWQEKLRQRERGVNQRDGELSEREAELNQRQAELDKRETKLEEWAASLEAWEERLTEQASLLEEKENDLAGQRDAIRVEQGRLVEEQNSLQVEQARLAQGWEELQSGHAYLDEEWARLREKEANLAEWEQTLEGRRRLSVVAAVMSGLLSVPSVVVLMAVIRQSQQPAKRVMWQAQALQTRHRGRAAQHGRVGPRALVPTCTDNGRDKEKVDHLLQRSVRSRRSTTRSGVSCAQSRGAPL